MKKKQKHAPAPTDYLTLRAAPVRTQRYPATRRIHDWWGGRRDGRLNLTSFNDDATTSTSSSTKPPGEPTAPELTHNNTVWLAHNTHRANERHRHEDLAHQARTVRLQIRLDTVVADLATAVADREEARNALDEIADLTGDDLQARGPAETRASNAVVAARRAREHDAKVLAPARARLSGTEDRVRALTLELHDLTAQLDTLADITSTRQARITELHERRSSIYRRAYSRARARQVRRDRRRDKRQQRRQTRRVATRPRVPLGG